jgi:sugar/nucleoside kinase (ribokinase family)
MIATDVSVSKNTIKEQETEMKDICCIGHITRDRIITPLQTVYMSGGTSFYFAYAFSHLPKEVSFQLVTKVGSDSMQTISDMQRAGIDVMVYPSRETVFFENKYGANQNDRTQRVLAKADPFTAEEMQNLDAKIFHLGTLLADDISADVVRLLSQKGRISIDAQGYLREVRGENVFATDWHDKLSILSFCDILKVNEQEMLAITGLSDPRQAARQLAEWGVKEVLVTLGSEGSIILSEGQFYDIPAYEPRRIADATGCGDTYSAGYLYCRSLGEGFEEAGKFAAAMCTLKLEHSGPFDRTVDEVKKIVMSK